MVVHLCLRASGREESSRLADLVLNGLLRLGTIIIDFKFSITNFIYTFLNINPFLIKNTRKASFISSKTVL